MEGDDAGGVPSMKDTNFSVEDDSGTNETDSGVITKTKVVLIQVTELALMTGKSYSYRQWLKRTRVFSPIPTQPSRRWTRKLRIGTSLLPSGSTWDC